jgi:hypothetical protein
MSADDRPFPIFLWDKDHRVIVCRAHRLYG